MRYVHYERVGLLQLLLRSTILSFYVCLVPLWRAGDSPGKQSKWRKKCTLISSPQSRRARQGRWGKFITVKERQKCDPLAPTLPPSRLPPSSDPRVLSRWGKTPAASLRHLRTPTKRLMSSANICMASESVRCGKIFLVFLAPTLSTSVHFFRHREGPG